MTKHLRGLIFSSFYNPRIPKQPKIDDLYKDIGRILEFIQENKELETQERELEERIKNSETKKEILEILLEKYEKLSKEGKEQEAIKILEMITEITVSL